MYNPVTSPDGNTPALDRIERWIEDPVILPHLSQKERAIMEAIRDLNWFRMRATAPSPPSPQE